MAVPAANKKDLHVGLVLLLIVAVIWIVTSFISEALVVGRGFQRAAAGFAASSSGSPGAQVACWALFTRDKGSAVLSACERDADA